VSRRTSVPPKSRPVPFAQIEYAHVVGYFRHNLPRPVQSISRIAERLEEVPGEGKFGVLIHSDTTLCKDNSLRPILDETRRFADIERIQCALIARERRGSDAKLVDYLWHVGYEPEERYDVAQRDCTIVTTVRLNGYRPDPTDLEAHGDLQQHVAQECAGRQASRELIDDIVRLTLEQQGLYYLLVDIAPMEETGASAIYEHGNAPQVHPRSLARHIETARWIRLRETRREFVRGVFWGNYLNPELLERLGGKEDFRHRYIEKAKQEVGNWRSLVQDTPQGGLFVKISRDPLDEIAGRIGTELAVWLHEEFRRIGALL
jgi:hypothetical protein